MNTITSGHVRAFQLVRSPLYDNITLSSCWINGEPGVAIIMVDQINEEQIAVMPLFVAITAGMAIEFPGDRGSGSGGGGGPKTPGEAFKAGRGITEPTPV